MKNPILAPGTFAYAPGAVPQLQPQGRALRRAIEQDRRWFERHPRRLIRVRDPVAGEGAALGLRAPTAGGYPLRVFVFYAAPGARRRLGLYTRLSSADPEPVLLAYLRLSMDAQRQGYTGELSNEDLAAALGVSGGCTQH